MKILITIVLPLFALIGSGYLAGRFKLVSAATNGGLNAFVYYFALPAMLFRALALRRMGDGMQLGFLAAWLTAGVVIYVFALVVGRWGFRATLGEAAVQGLGAEFPNSGYLAIPLGVSLFGPSLAVPIALTMLIDMSVFLSVTIILLEIGGRGGGGWKMLGKDLAKALGLNPLFLSIWAGVVFPLLALPLPVSLGRFLETLGQAATPCALFALGVSMYGRSLSTRRGELAFITAVKLLVHPLLMLVLTVFVFPVPPHWVMAAVLTAAVPSASSVFIVAQRYGVYQEQASALVLVSTVLGIPTLTLVIHWLA